MGTDASSAEAESSIRGFSMANQLAVVTGASSGIGFELAKQLASKGYDLIVAAESDRLDTAVAEFQGAGVSVQAIKANLADKEGVDTLWQAIEATGRPWMSPASMPGWVWAGSFSRLTSTLS